MDYCFSTKQKYKDTPEIFGWQLTNEGRYLGCDPSLQGCDTTLQNWIAEMSAELKIYDPNHMVGCGTEGFFKYSSSYKSYGPGL